MATAWFHKALANWVRSDWHSGFALRGAGYSASLGSPILLLEPHRLQKDPMLPSSRFQTPHTGRTRFAEDRHAGPQSGQGMRQSGARVERFMTHASADRLSSHASIAETRIRRRLPSLTDAISFDEINSYSFVRPMPAIRAASDGDTARRAGAGVESDAMFVSVFLQTEQFTTDRST